MVTTGLFTIPAILVFAAVHVLVAELPAARATYVSVAWLPSAFLLLMYRYSDYFSRTFTYGVILIVMLVSLISLLWGLLGVMLLIRLRVRRKSLAAATISTCIAFVPALFYVVLVFS